MRGPTLRVRSLKIVMQGNWGPGGLGLLEYFEVNMF